jgi:phosphoribosyl-ATP pyrophosphohydrolase/phosphoribosyl-AMP cyclohydrolase/histidinol dehydrogenase
MTRLMPTVSLRALRRSARPAVDGDARSVAEPIVDRVLRGGLPAALREGRRFGEVAAGASVVLDRSDLRRSLDRARRSLGGEPIRLLERAAERIRRFAAAQRASVRDIACRTDRRDGRMTLRQRMVPLATAGCYAPGGRYPLPSSALMTAIPARVAGVAEVWLATPKPTPIMLAAAAIAQVDGLLALGGAHAIALLARGDAAIGPPSSIVVGPGNAFVTAAKAIIRERGLSAIDGLAGPSEVLIVADASADPATVAADCIAQAEHDPQSMVWLLATDERLPNLVRRALREQLADLPTAPIARVALLRSRAVVLSTIDEAVTLANELAPEHLELHVRRAATVARRCVAYGSLFVGGAAAEVFGDYGIGPNHTLPTGGTARHAAGLSVFDFLRARTSVEGQPSPALVREVAGFARLEGLEGHARAATRRSPSR